MIIRNSKNWIRVSCIITSGFFFFRLTMKTQTQTELSLSPWFFKAVKEWVGWNNYRLFSELVLRDIVFRAERFGVKGKLNIILFCLQFIYAVCSNLSNRVLVMGSQSDWIWFRSTILSTWQYKTRRVSTEARRDVAWICVTQPFCNNRYWASSLLLINRVEHHYWLPVCFSCVPSCVMHCVVRGQ